MSCASACGRGDPEPAARSLLREVARAMEHGDAAAVDARIARPSAGLGPDRALALRSMGPDRMLAVEGLVAAALGRASSRARVRVTAQPGETGPDIALERVDQRWSVDPESLALRCPTPAAAIEQLILALEAADSEPAMALLTEPLREATRQASRERVRGLREALTGLPASMAGRLQLQIDYGRGLFLLLRYEHGDWRIDDFN